MMNLPLGLCLGYGESSEKKKGGYNHTLWLFNIAMEAIAHLQMRKMMIYLLNMVIFHGYVK